MSSTIDRIILLNDLHLLYARDRDIFRNFLSLSLCCLMFEKRGKLSTLRCRILISLTFGRTARRQDRTRPIFRARSHVVAALLFARVKLTNVPR